MPQVLFLGASVHKVWSAAHTQVGHFSGLTILMGGNFVKQKSEKQVRQEKKQRDLLRSSHLNVEKPKIMAICSAGLCSSSPGTNTLGQDCKGADSALAMAVALEIRSVR